MIVVNKIDVTPLETLSEEDQATLKEMSLEALKSTAAGETESCFPSADFEDLHSFATVFQEPIAPLPITLSANALETSLGNLPPDRTKHVEKPELTNLTYELC